MKKRIKIVSFLCALTLITSLMLTPVFAATAYTYGGYANTSYSFDVSTGNASRILTFSQKKGSIDYSKASTGTGSYSTYGQYLIYITCNGTLYKSCRFDFKPSLSVTLPKNKTYTVCVIPRSPAAVFSALVDSNKISKAKILGWNVNYASPRWRALPDWTVSAPVRLNNWKTATPAW